MNEPPDWEAFLFMFVSYHSHMKQIILILIYINVSSLSAQKEIRDSINYLTFNLNFPADTIGYDEIDFQRENPISEFTLTGSTNLRYSLKLENDTIALLSQFKDGKYSIQEKFKYESFFLYREDNILHSQYKITDFDNDGDEDLLLWIFSNMNGNTWTIIFLNDEKTNRLVKLYDTAEDTDKWDRPEYDSATKIINCTLEGSAFGISAESTFKLNGLKAEPLTRHYEDRTHSRYIIDYDYIGKDGKWKLMKKKKHR